MKKQQFLGVLIFVLTTSLLGIKCLTPSYRVVSVTDGDTIQVQKTRFLTKPETITVRYLNIDTPELEGQECFAQKAKELNEKLVLNQKIRLVVGRNEFDRYERTLAYVFIADQETSINEQLLAAGAGKFYLDTVNQKYQNPLIIAAENAYNQKNGLWRNCAPDPEIGCVIKGNLDSSDKRWYHLPTFRHYDQTIVNLDQGDQWFCTEEEAVKTGFTRARE